MQISDDEEVRQWRRAGMERHNAHVLHRTTARSKTCTLNINWSAESNPNQLGGSFHTEYVVNFENGTDLIEQLRKMSLPAAWSRIAINAADMAYDSRHSWYTLQPIWLADISTRNNYMKTGRVVFESEERDAMRSLPELIDTYCTECAYNKLRIRNLLNGNDADPPTNDVNKELSQIRINLFVFERPRD